ncbi:MAG: hypothetical protein ACK50N_00295 [Flavobacteriales bacterium]
MKVISYAFLFIPMLGICQEEERISPLNLLGNREGQMFFTWGYNRAFYDESDIHFKGDGFDFTLYEVDAEDMPEPFNPSVYFDPGKLTIPQFNFRLGYYVKKNTAISMGWDHMKYHAISTQRVRMSGYIDERYNPGSQLVGTFNDEYVTINKSFMDYHHSDGFNFVRFAIEQRVPLWMSRNGKHMLAANGAASIGFMLPWTDWTFFGVHYRNKPHVAGYGFSLATGMRFEFFKHFFIQGNVQIGKTNLTDILLQDHLDSRASQKIDFIERSWALGCYFPIKKK